VTGDRQAYFWGTHSGHELDLLVFVNGRRIGVEVKYGDAVSMMPTNSPFRLTTGLPELPPMMSAVHTALGGMAGQFLQLPQRASSPLLRSWRLESRHDRQTRMSALRYVTELADRTTYNSMDWVFVAEEGNVEDGGRPGFGGQAQFHQPDFTALAVG